MKAGGRPEAGQLLGRDSQARAVREGAADEQELDRGQAVQVLDRRAGPARDDQALPPAPPALRRDPGGLRQGDRRPVPHRAGGRQRRGDRAAPDGLGADVAAGRAAGGRAAAGTLAQARVPRREPEGRDPGLRHQAAQRGRRGAGPHGAQAAGLPGQVPEQDAAAVLLLAAGALLDLRQDLRPGAARLPAVPKGSLLL